MPIHDAASESGKKERAKVYFCDMRVRANGKNLLEKLASLLKYAGMSKLDFENHFAAIKLHFGEPGNLSFLRPNFAKVVVDEIKKLGGIPFLTDCSTLYVGRRKSAPEHLESAFENGFSPFSTGCPIIIGDGLKGTDDIEVDVPGGVYVQKAKIGRVIMDSDLIISLSHFKGHELAGFGGAIKNIGMGCASRGGKMEQHCDGKPQVVEERCTGCHFCAKICAHDAPDFQTGKAVINHAKCVGCGRCLAVCPQNAIEPEWGQEDGLLDKKMAEYAWAVLHGKPHFHISIAMDISPFCDCHAENDAPIVPNVGMFASFDPVALDQACADAVNKQTPLPNSLLSDHGDQYHDHFKNVSPNTNWSLQLEHAEMLGLGTRDYELIDINSISSGRSRRR